MSEQNNKNNFNLRNVILSSMYYNIKLNRQSFHFPNILLSEMLLLKNNIKKYLNKKIKNGFKGYIHSYLFIAMPQTETLLNKKSSLTVRKIYSYIHAKIGIHNGG